MSTSRIKIRIFIFVLYFHFLNVYQGIQKFSIFELRFFLSRFSKFGIKSHKKYFFNLTFIGEGIFHFQFLTNVIFGFGILAVRSNCCRPFLRRPYIPSHFPCPPPFHYFSGAHSWSVITVNSERIVGTSVPSTSFQALSTSTLENEPITCSTDLFNNNLLREGEGGLIHSGSTFWA